jgi:L-lactate utilization protein LutC
LPFRARKIDSEAPLSSPRQNRAEFLERVQTAASAGNRAGVAIPHPERAGVGYQGAGPDPVRHFAHELAAVGGLAHLVPSAQAAVACVIDLAQNRNARRVLLGEGALFDQLGLADRLVSIAIEVIPSDASRDRIFAADLGISAVDALIAETGSIVQASRPGQPRSLSLLPPCYIAIADRSQLYADLFDWFDTFPVGDLPASISLITGPSKTGDIELKLVTGVHGPGEVHVILVNP